MSRRVNWIRWLFLLEVWRVSNVEELRRLAGHLMSVERLTYEAAIAKVLRDRPDLAERRRPNSVTGGGDGYDHAKARRLAERNGEVAMVGEYRSFVEFTKVDAEQQIVEGYASTPDVDSQGDIVTPEAMKVALVTYSGAIREMHQPIAAGRVLEAKVEDTGGTRIRAKIGDASTWSKVKDGILRGFSIAGRTIKRVGNEIREIRLTEISLVDVPANPACTITLWKADGAPASIKQALTTSDPDDASYLARVAKVDAMLEGRVEKASGGVWAELTRITDAMVGGDRVANAATVLKGDPSLRERIRLASIPSDAEAHEQLEFFLIRAGADGQSRIEASQLFHATHPDVAWTASQQSVRGTPEWKDLQSRLAARSAAVAQEKRAAIGTGPIRFADVVVEYRGQVVTEAANRAAWLSLLKRGEHYNGLTFKYAGHELNRWDLTMKVE